MDKFIKFFKAESNYTHIYYNDGSRQMFARTLKKFEDSLVGKGFFRAHHSYLVNVKSIVRVSSLGLILECGAVIPISRKLSRKDVKKILTFNH